MAADSDACSPAVVPPSLVWPLDASTGVTIDTPVIVQSPEGASPPSVDLVAPDDTLVELQIHRVLHSPGSRTATFLLAPGASLAPQSSYTLRLTVPGTEAGTVDTSWHFETGTSTRSAPTSSDVELNLLGLRMDGGKFLELFVGSSAQEMLWVLADGRVTAAGTRAWPVDIPLGPVSCADVEVVDSSGTTLLQRSMCDPARCTWATSYDSCTDYPNAHWPQWATASQTNCVDSDAGSVTTEDKDERSSGSGCDIGRRTASPRPDVLLFLSVAFLGIVNGSRGRYGRRRGASRTAERIGISRQALSPVVKRHGT